MNYSLNAYAQPLTASQATHLLRRATFGPTQNHILAFTGISSSLAIDTLLNNINYNPTPPVDLNITKTTVGLPYIVRGLNVEDNIRSILQVVEEDHHRREHMLEELLAEFSITHLRFTPSIALSGGERRRVEIARALATHPQFILLDEPLAGIDPIAVGEIRDLVKHLKNRNIGVLITDHNVRDTLDIVDRAYILHGGQVLMEGKPSDIVAHKDVRRVYLGEKFSL